MYRRPASISLDHVDISSHQSCHCFGSVLLQTPASVFLRHATLPSLSPDLQGLGRHPFNPRISLMLYGLLLLFYLPALQSGNIVCPIRGGLLIGSLGIERIPVLVGSNGHIYC
jgi:hypothetical protein